MKLTQLLLLVALVGAFCGATATFPYCRCTQYSFAASPYVLGAEPSGALERNGVATVNLNLLIRNISESPKPNPSLPCFDILRDQGIQKLTIDTSDTCHGNVDIFVNGELCNSGTCWVETKSAGQSYVRIGSKPPVTAGDFPPPNGIIPIKLVGRGPCGTLAALLNNPAGTPVKDTIYKYALFHTTTTKPPQICCPHSQGKVDIVSQGTPLAPPPPPSGFPYCNCNKRTANTEIDSMYLLDTGDAAPVWTVAMSFKATPCDPAASKCCNMDFKKLELPVSMNCRHAITNVIVDHAHKSTSFTDYKNGRLVFKITNNALSAAQMDGIQISFDIQKNSTCDALPSPRDTLFTEPMYALFGNGQYQSCCPTRPLPDITIILPDGGSA